MRDLGVESHRPSTADLGDAERGEGALVQVSAECLSVSRGSPENLPLLQQRVRQINLDVAPA